MNLNLVNRYSEYKNSDIVWLGNIPKHWQIRRVKDLAEYQSGEYINANDFDETNSYPVYGGNGFRGFADKYNHNGDYILIGRQGALCGNINYASGKFWATEHAVVVYRKKNVNIKWFGEFLRVMNLNQYALSAAQPGLSVDKVKRLELALPPLTEQNSIASFINHHTAIIDKRVSLLENKISAYKDLAKSLINVAVCKGLNKDVPLKDSGIEWIGEIPKHWQVKRLKDVGYLYSGLSGKTGEHFNQEVSDNSQHYIPFTNIANNKYINHEDLHTVLMDENERQNKVKKNDLFFLMSSEGFADIGKSALLIEDVKDTYLNSFCKGYRITKKTVVPKYLNYLLNSPAFRDKFIVQGKGFTRINLKMEKVSDFEFVIPPVEEQTAIAEHLDKKTTTIDAIVANIKLQIDSLKELRKTLINDVVTGKLKVTE